MTWALQHDDKYAYAIASCMACNSDLQCSLQALNGTRLVTAALSQLVHRCDSLPAHREPVLEFFALGLGQQSFWHLSIVILHLREIKLMVMVVV